MLNNLFNARVGLLHTIDVNQLVGGCKHCQFACVSSVLSVMDFPSIVCLHMLSVGTSLISMQGKHWQR